MRVIVDEGYRGSGLLASTRLVLDFSSEGPKDKLEGSLPWFGFSEVPDSDHLTAESVARLSKLLEYCVRNHRACARKQFDPNAMPRRLLALEFSNGSIIIKLWETLNKEVQFLALSHCWGELQIITTTRENYQDHLSGVPFASLSQTFQDAVLLTLALGKHYIWIDSLCIIQNDPDDWACEAGNMGGVYENAILVIAASAARDGSIGIKRLESMVYGCEFMNGQEKLGTVLIRRPFNHSDYSGNYDDVVNLYNGRLLNPVETRAWTFQEQIHARRLIKFTAREMIFQCLERTRCECGDLDEGLSGRLGEMRKNVRIQKSKYHARRSPETWYEILELFQRLQIKFTSDRLPALSATAQRLFHEPRRYIAGLPRDDLPRYLLWARKPHQLENPQPRPKDCVAPSWSWASISEEFIPSIAALPGYTFTISLTRKTDFDDLVPRVRHMRFIEGSVQVVDIKPEYATPDPFGNVKSAELIIAGYTCEAQLEKTEESESKYRLRSAENWFGRPSRHPDMETDKVIVDVDIHDPSSPDYTTKEASLKLLFFHIKRSTLTKDALHALILLPKGGNRHTRIGIAYDLDHNWCKARTFDGMYTISII